MKSDLSALYLEGQLAVFKKGNQLGFLEGQLAQMKSDLSAIYLEGQLAVFKKGSQLGFQKGSQLI